MDTTEVGAAAPKPKRLFAPWVWTPFFVGVGALGLVMMSRTNAGCTTVWWIALGVLAATLIYFCVQGVARLLKREWTKALFAFVRFMVLAAPTLPTLAAIFMLALLIRDPFEPSEDHFADNLSIPVGIEIAEPVEDASGQPFHSDQIGTDALQIAVRKALAIAGSEDAAFAPSMPSLRAAATEHPNEFRDYIEASPDWHVFMERGNRFAARRWSYNGEPRDTLHGYISDVDGSSQFQTRCLLCLDRKQWSSYSVQHVQEGAQPVKPDMSTGNNLAESRVMIECGGVWVEIFEQSGKPERRITKATIATLEKEFSEFQKNPQAAIAQVKEKSRELARRLAAKDDKPFRLLNGMQPGMYTVAYSLNPGAPGVVYLKAFEVTKGKPLSVEDLREASETRMTWSANPSDRFGSKAGFMIYEGDWGKPYAARFEVWFKPDAGGPERKLAERIFKIEGWQR